MVRDPAKLPRAVLWDMDGTLLDSAEYHWLTWADTFAGQGVTLSRDQFDRTFGRRNVELLRESLGPDLSHDEIVRLADAKEERYRDLVRTRGVDPLPGVHRWLTALHAAGWRQVIASSAPRPNIEAVLEALGLADRFEAVVSAEDVTRGKPDPQVFLTAAARVGVPPARCVVVEDAPAGVEAGRRAGMKTIGVGRHHASLPADLTVPTLDALPADAFDTLVPS